MFRSLCFLPLLALVAVAACGSPVLEPQTRSHTAGEGRPGSETDPGDAPLTPSPRAAPVIGVVSQVPAPGEPGAFLVEERPEVSAAGAVPQTSGSYHVRVTEETRIRLRTAAGESRSATSDEIVVGMRAEIWFVGAVQRSYPAQGTAGRILLLETP